jgi:hypothetical protein
MPKPFSKVFRRPGVGRILLPFTMALFLLGFALLQIAG